MKWLNVRRFLGACPNILVLLSICKKVLSIVLRIILVVLVLASVPPLIKFVIYLRRQVVTLVALLPRHPLTLSNLLPKCGGKTVSFTILTRLTPLPPTPRMLGRGRKTLLGNLGEAWPPCSIRLSLNNLLPTCVTGATAPRGTFLAIRRTLVVLLEQFCYVLRTKDVVLVNLRMLPLVSWTMDTGYPMTLVRIEVN